jgi:hypothetical protein
MKWEAGNSGTQVGSDIRERIAGTHRDPSGRSDGSSADAEQERYCLVKVRMSEFCVERIAESGPHGRADYARPGVSRGSGDSCSA